MVLNSNPLAPIQSDATLAPEMLDIIDLLHNDLSVEEEAPVSSETLDHHDNVDRLRSSSYDQELFSVIASYGRIDMYEDRKGLETHEIHELVNSMLQYILLIR